MTRGWDEYENNSESFGYGMDDRRHKANFSVAMADRKDTLAAWHADELDEVEYTRGWEYEESMWRDTPWTAVPGRQ